MNVIDIHDFTAGLPRTSLKRCDASWKTLQSRPLHALFPFTAIEVVNVADSHFVLAHVY